MKRIIGLIIFLITTNLLGLTVIANTSTISYIKNNEVFDGSFNMDNLALEDDLKEIQIVNDKYYKYIDYGNGYSLNYPNDMWIDVTLSPIKTVIANESTKIEVYYDDFNDTVHWPSGYINYSNTFLLNRNDHELEEKKIINVNGFKVQLIRWQREVLSRVTDDKNYYVSAEIITEKRQVYTILIKSDAPISNHMDIITSFSIVPKKGTSKIVREINTIEKNFNEETYELYNKYFVDNEKLNWGIYYPGAPREMFQLLPLEEKLDYKFNILVRYQTLDTQLPLEDIQRAYEDNRLVELTLQTMKMNESNSGIIYEILSGKYDEYFKDYATGLKSFGHPVLFRLNNEMNGDWCVYSSFHHSKDTDLYKKMWIYIYEIFEENAVDNVIWVWNPNDISYPSFKWNHYINYYPGDKYVDIIGMTGYNTGTYYKGEKWRGFQNIYGELYQEYLEVFNKPFMITEFGSNSVGGSKEEWLEEMFQYIDEFKNIKAAIWFNEIDWDSYGAPARDYKLEEYIEIFKYGFSNY